MDHDNLGRASDDLIGSTSIDLEDRLFSRHYMRNLSGTPPVEWRSLYSPISKHEQGKLELWVDILKTQDEFGRTIELPPPYDIAPPPEQKWELRLIIWKGRNLPSDLDDSGLADFYVTAKMQTSTAKGKAGKAKSSSTDTHFRSSNGRASWNYRIKVRGFGWLQG